MWTTAALLLIAAAAKPGAAPVIAVEAEAFTAKKGPWRETTGASGKAMIIETGGWGDHLHYKLRFDKPGTYKLWLLGRSGGDGGSDEVKVFFNQPPDSKGTYFEVRFPANEFGWSNKMFYKTPENRKTPGVPTLEVKKAGTYDLYLAKGAEPECHTPPCQRAFPNWQVDKIMLRLDDEAPSVVTKK